MKKIYLIFFLCVGSLASVRGQLNEWTWVNGDVASIAAVTGTQGVFDSLNHPAPTYAATGWVDHQGHFWYFSTTGFLWEYDPSIQQWRFVWNGTSVQPVFGVKGVPAITNQPGFRSFGHLTWTDASGDLWFFSGYCSGITYADLWRYSIATNLWTWVGGSNVPNDLGVYGIKGVPSVNNYPMGRCESNASWLDTTNNVFWLYGGDRAVNYTSIGDLWKYDLATGEWTWMHGDTANVAPPVYGTQRIPDPANHPGGRLVYCKWNDLNGNFYLFGGSQDVFTYKNDTWKYNQSTNEWTWMTGTMGTSAPGVDNGYCNFDPSNTPPSEFENRSCWTDHCGSGWAFGAAYNNIWSFQSQTGEWSLVKGNANSNVPVNYGVKGVSDPTNNPATVNGAIGWKGLDGSMYFLNHSTNSVMWRFVPDPQCIGCALVPTALFTAPNHICPGTCTDFTNLSQFATSYLWIFNGANPPVSTDANPANICYNTPGNYSVQLIAASSTGTDTLTLNNYITVYPYPAPQGILQSGDTLIANQGAVTYQWYFGGSPIAGATDYFYIAHQSGDYNVVCTDLNGCEVEAVINDVIASVGAIGNFAGLMVFPNPVRDVLHLQIPGGTVWKEIAVYNVLGKQLGLPESSFGVNSEFVLDVRMFVSGMYWIEFRGEVGALRGKFVKE